MKTTLTGFVLFISMVMMACKKGDTGPQGPSGNANVKYSSWNALNMQFSTADSLYEQTITADSLTQAILDSGVVLTYIKFINSSNQPSIVNASSYMDVLYSKGKIALYSYYDFSGNDFRYVLIPGGVKTGRLASSNISVYSKEELQKMSYAEVMRLLGQ